MYYRITRVRHSAENRQAMIDLLKSKEEVIRSFPGLHYVRMIAVSDTETVAISEYESEAALNAVQARFREVMVDMMPLLPVSRGARRCFLGTGRDEGLSIGVVVGNPRLWGRPPNTNEAGFPSWLAGPPWRPYEAAQESPCPPQPNRPTRPARTSSP